MQLERERHRKLKATNLVNFMKFDKSFPKLIQPPVGHGHLCLKPHALHLIHGLQWMKTILCEGRERERERERDLQMIWLEQNVYAYSSEESCCLHCLVNLVNSEEVLDTLAIDVSVGCVQCPCFLHPLG